MLSSLVFGLRVSGRFNHKKRLEIIPLHLFISILISVFFIGEFLYGLWKAQWFFILDYHSIIGLSIVVVALFANIMSPCISGKVIDQKISSKIHAILAILLLVLVIVQVLNGYLLLKG